MLPEGCLTGKSIVEVGAYDVNGSCRPLILQHLPSSYLGIDISSGPGVDLVCSAEDLPTKIGRESVDIVICTEVLEHVDDWKRFIESILSVLRHDGILLLTTRSPGFPLHNYPSDHWRFTLKNMLEVFAEQEILTVTVDPTSDPGVGVIIRKKSDSVLTTIPFPPC